MTDLSADLTAQKQKLRERLRFLAWWMTSNHEGHNTHCKHS